MRAGAASEFYDLIVNSKRREIVERFDEVAKLPLTHTERAVFEAATERARERAVAHCLSDRARPRAHRALARSHPSLEGIAAIQARCRPRAPGAPAARRALRSLGRQREAIPILLQISEASVDKEVMDEATLLLAECQVDIQAWNDAKNTLRAFIRRFPSSPHLLDAKAKLADISLHH